MALTTRIAAAQDALKAALVARGGLSGVKVSVGDPAELLAEHIVIAGGVDDWVQELDTTGSMATALREENFTLTVSVVVKRSADDFATVRNRALTLAGEVEKQLRDDHTLTGTVHFAEAAPAAMHEGRDGRERACVVEMGVAVQAFLS